MGFFDDVKEDQTLQIQVVCVTFFLLVFPAYFFLKAAATDDVAGMGGVGTYTVDGEFSYIDFDNGGEYIADGDTLTIPLNTDALNSEDQTRNIVGVLLSLTYGEDESGRGPPCLSQTAPDTISGTATHLNFTNSTEGQNDGNGGHDVSTEWYNSSMIGTEVTGLSEAEIAEQLDSNGAGLGDYTLEITVSAQGDSCTVPGQPANEDNGEDVSYTVQLIVLDYSITPYIDIDDIDV